MRINVKSVDENGSDVVKRPGKETLQATPGDNVRGAIYMTLGMAGFVFNDTLMKSLADELPMFQAMFVRSIFATVLIGLFAWYRRALVCRLAVIASKSMGLRIVGEIGATIFFITALFNMPIANATAILQVTPLAVTLGAALFLGESVGWRRYSAIIVGFLGVLVIVRPGADGFTIYSVYALAAVFFLVLRDLSTKQLPVEMSSLLATVLSSLAILIMSGSVTATIAWQPMALHQIGILALAAVFVLVGYLFTTMTMRVGDIGFSSPFRYTILIWAIILGLLVFGDVPDLFTLIGSTIVVVTGLYAFYRERQLTRTGHQKTSTARV